MIALCVFSVMPAMGTRKGLGWCKRGPGAAVASCFGNDGRGQDVVATERMGRGQIREDKTVLFMINISIRY